MFASRGKDWQRCARQWYAYGVLERGDLCQWLADYWNWPLWKQLIFVDMAHRVQDDLDKLPSPLHLDKPQA